ncbi:hypothetical protein P691DRAFT_804722 [Macrolepiota fuliginosa MF-IS2]|uniref:Uncharacterized protein n=1 Tax=Macrolepiota fuliginosa MF-IS2 TaxID=1400762 RepID=A0A9P6BVU9_9AGAR|nr:hypothetical protein P691DRAFT_804722 [Macrolepiota fuliginosa MF-IS2]
MGVPTQLQRYDSLVRQAASEADRADGGAPLNKGDVRPTEHPTNGGVHELVMGVVDELGQRHGW